MTDPHHLYDQPWLSEAGSVHEIVPRDNYERRAELVRVVDGDTLHCRLDMGGRLLTDDVVRLSWVNTPEHRGHEYEAGHWVTARLIELLGDEPKLQIRSREFRLDKYGRYVADVYCLGTWVNRWLIERRFGWPTDASGQIIGGGRDIDRLTGIPADIRRRVQQEQGASR